ncbi:MAG: AAA-like domain-containing protein [Rhizonema sp. PD37]|nr:AAA-like domain-containing protein [Rhizonema sp. PD37]
MSKKQEYYQVGGNLEPDNPSYIERQADKNLYEGLKARNFCYVFNSRQMGKSSLLVRVSKKLEENEGFCCAAISLEGIGTQGFTQEQWYYTFITYLARKFKLQTKRLETWWQERKLLAPLKRLSDFFEEILLIEVSQNIVIFIDEIDTVLSLDFPTDDFFAFIRYCYNERANNPNYKRISFALLGVASPSQLIQDTQRTPFNIGEAIQLNPFSFEDSLPLAQGLENKVSDSKIAEDILREVLNWTGGQPFLTQKICQIIVNYEEVIPANKNAIPKWIEKIVNSNVIENWEDQDNPQHLKTIRDRIINSKEHTFKLLKLYLKIWQQKELQAEYSIEQSELILSGLVVENTGNLKISNRIYESVFNSKWIAEILADKRPYEEEFLKWLASERKEKSWLSRGQKLRIAMEWSNKHSLTVEDYQFLKASQELEIKSLQHSRSIISAIAVFILIGFVITGLQLTEKIKSLFFPYVLDPELFSQGERDFFLGEQNYFLKQGIEYFENSDYHNAEKQFEKAKKDYKDDIEAEIYYNNTLAHQNDNYLSLAVIVPINATKKLSQEILRGVAQAQSEYNKKATNKDRLLNIVIVNDNDDPSQAQTVAQELIKDKKVLGVIGHASSAASEKALPEYQNAGLAMISSTSTSTALSQEKFKVFFRTIPSDKMTAEMLAKYAINQRLKRVVIYYQQGDIYSESFKNAFTKSLNDQGGSVVRSKDLTDPTLVPFDEVDSVITDKVNAVVFLPKFGLISTIIGIAGEQQKMIKTKTLPKTLKLLGGDTLYSSETLQRGQEAIEGLVVAVPWFAKQSGSKNFAERACERWGGGVSWETAATYDATQAFIKAMSKLDNPTRQTVLEKLPFIKLSNNETSGSELKFIHGERNNAEPVLVKVVKDKANNVSAVKDKANVDHCGDFQVGGYHFEEAHEK